MFCDRSKVAFGFAAHACNADDKSNILLSKVKRGPVKGTYSIPTLECVMNTEMFKNHFRCLKDIYNKLINVCVNSQVLLNWMLIRERRSQI